MVDGNMQFWVYRTHLQPWSHWQWCKWLDCTELQLYLLEVGWDHLYSKFIQQHSQQLLTSFPNHSIPFFWHFMSWFKQCKLNTWHPNLIIEHYVWCLISGITLHCRFSAFEKLTPIQLSSQQPLPFASRGPPFCTSWSASKGATKSWRDWTCFFCDFWELDLNTILKAFSKAQYMLGFSWNNFRCRHFQNQATWSSQTN